MAHEEEDGRSPRSTRLHSIDGGPLRLRMAAACGAIAATVLAGSAIWLGIPAVFVVSDADFIPFPLGLAAAFAAFGVSHLAQGLWDLLRRSRAGISSLEAGPAIMGRWFSGRIRTATDLAATGPYRIRLVCEHHMASEDSDGSRHRSTVVLWEKAVTAPGATRSDSGIPFTFHIPASGLPSGPGGLPSGDAIVWRLLASAPTSGLNYAAEFLVEVDDAAGADEARPRSVDAAFAGYARPERPGMRILRLALTLVGALLVAAGGYATFRQALLTAEGVAVPGTLAAFNRPRAEVVLDGGQTVTVPGISRHNRWQEGQRVVVTCRMGGARYDTCRMDTGHDRWIDAAATLAIGLVITAAGACLWWRRPASKGRKEPS